MTNTNASGLAKRAADVAAAPKPPNELQVLKSQLDRYKPVIQKLLAGTGIGEETFIAQIANAVRLNRALLSCQTETLLGAALKAAQLGLSPNDSRNLCWILPYGRQAQFQLGYGGVMELAKRAVPGLKIDGHEVYPNDDFDVDYGKPEPLTHRPAVAKRLERGGDAFAWYVRARYPDGDIQVHVIDREQVEYHRNFSKQPNGDMWKKSYNAGALKSCVLDMRRWLPSSPQMVAAMAADEQVIDVDNIDEYDDAIEVDTPALEAGVPDSEPFDVIAKTEIKSDDGKLIK